MVYMVTTPYTQYTKAQNPKALNHNTQNPKT